MITNDVASPNDLACDVGTLLHEAADQEKSCMHIVAGKDLQQAQGVRIVGTIIIGERDLLAAASQAGECAPVPLPRGRHRLISCSDGAERRATSQDKAEHAGIVSDCRMQIGECRLMQIADFRFRSTIRSSVVRQADQRL